MKLELTYPLKPYYVTQKFGETAFLDYYKNNGVKFAGHNGLDLICHHGDAVRATHDGFAYYEVDSKQGQGVVVISKEPFDLLDGTNSFIKTIYWHLCDPVKEPNYISPIRGNDGVEVKIGDILGYTDSTGLSTGDHLHFALKPVMRGEPNNTFYNVLQENGYNGAIDPAPYFNGRFAEDSQIFTFEKNLKVGDDNEDVRQLQKVLRRLGYFSFPTDTGYYGQATRDAVYRFQLDNVKLGFLAKNVFKGLYFYEASRQAINKLIIK